MRTLIGIVVVVAGIGIIYYLYKNKTLVNILGKQSDATATKANETASVPKKEGSITYVKNADGTLTPVVTPPVVVPPVVTPPVVVPPVVTPPVVVPPVVVNPKYSNKIVATFEGGQVIYRRSDGVDVQDYINLYMGGLHQGIGFLANSSILHDGNVEFKNGEYSQLPYVIEPVILD